MYRTFFVIILCLLVVGAWIPVYGEEGRILASNDLEIVKSEGYGIASLRVPKGEALGKSVVELSLQAKSPDKAKLGVYFRFYDKKNRQITSTFGIDFWGIELPGEYKEYKRVVKLPFVDIDYIVAHFYRLANTGTVYLDNIKLKMVEQAKAEDWSKFTELLKNPGFEEVIDNKPSGWKIGNHKIVSDINDVRNGKHALKIELKPDENYTSVSSHMVNMDKSGKYHVGFWVKGEGRVTLSLYRLMGLKRVTSRHSRDLFKDTWTFCEAEFESDAPGRTLAIQILLYRDGKGDKYMYLDDCTVSRENIEY